jgi:TolB-like protein/cytochrome c-type biogenesis protein CcmH/NrfG
VASIAVLPFVNRSGSPDDEYFSDGLADELLNVLAKIKGLRVPARTSAFTFKGKQATVGEIGRALGVATILEGSVRKVANRVRIAVQLVSVAEGSSLWSETYDRTLDDILAVQDDIAHSVVKELRVALLGEEADSRASGEAKAQVAKAMIGRTSNPEAHRLYLLARHLLDRQTREDVASAIEYLKQGLARDPEFALAWAELGRAYTREGDLGWAPVGEAFERARGAAQRALSVEPDLAEGYAVIGRIQMGYDWNWHDAEASLARALELAPGNPQVLRQAGALNTVLGRLDDAIELNRRALEQDPLSAQTYHNLAVALDAANRFAEAETAYRKALELTPQRPATHAYLSLILLAQGRGDEALAMAQRESHATFGPFALAIVNHALGHTAESDAAQGELIQKRAEHAAYQIAEAHAARGEFDTAFEWLERACAQRDPGFMAINRSRYLRPLRGDPRWGPLLKQVGLEE